MNKDFSYNYEQIVNFLLINYEQNNCKQIVNFLLINYEDPKL